jgi:flagellar P-ring protein precursor FlgI
MLCLLIVLLASPALGARVGDVTTLAGLREERLVGMGLVVGLDGTGDGGDFLPAIRPLASMLEQFNNAASPAELTNADNVALVTLSVTVPAEGVRNGDQLDVFVESIGAAQSLRGGRLIIVPLVGPTGEGPPLALAAGSVVLEDPLTPTVGLVREGATMEADLLKDYVFDGRFTLVINKNVASPAMAANIARVINDSEDGRDLAVAHDAKNVVVTIPPAERGQANHFIARLQRLPVPTTGGQSIVTINSRTGTIVLSGDVEIGPAVISHRGLTITTAPPNAAMLPERSEFLAIDTADRGGAKLRDLLASLDQLKVPAEDRIAIVLELHKAGKLHAKLVQE